MELIVPATLMLLICMLAYKIRLKNIYSSTILCLIFAFWWVIGGLSVVISLANIIEIKKELFDELFVVLGALAAFFCFKVKTKSVERENWLVNIILITLSSIWVFFVSKTGVCDAVSCDTIHHLAHLKQFELSDSFSFENYSITSSMPNDANYFAYAGATYLVLIDVFSRWFGISSEYFFYSVVPTFSCVTAVSASYILGDSFFQRSSERVLGGVLAAALSALIFSIYFPVAFAGYPQLWSVGYPSALASFAGMFLFGSYIRLSEKQQPDLVSLCSLFLFTIAIVPLHSGFSIIIALIMGLYWVVNLVCQLFFARVRLRLLSSSNLGFFLFLFGWLISIGPKLLAMSAYPDTSVPDIGLGIDIPYLNDSSFGTIFAPSIFNFNRLALLTFVGLSCAVLLIIRSRVRNGAGLIILTKVYCTILLCYALLFIPFFTDFLISIVSFAVLVRVHWFTDFVLLIGVAIAFVLITERIKLNLQLRRYLYAVAAIAFSLIGIQQFNKHYLIANASKQSWSRLDLLTRSELLDIDGYRTYLESLPRGSRYLIYNRGKFDGSTKHVELGLINGQLIQPVYVFSKVEGLRHSHCMVTPDISSMRLVKLIEDCRPNFIIFWEWPDEAIDPIVSSNLIQRDRTFSLKLNGNKLLKINIHKVLEEQSSTF